MCVSAVLAIAAPMAVSHAKCCFSKEEIGAGKGLGLGQPALLQRRVVERSGRRQAGNELP